jgi:5-(carboxyamino)imidazole ribonucleotide synthase
MSAVHGPGSRLGIMGGGQLGRMLALAARRLGYRVHVFAPGGNSPAGQVADQEVTAGYHDEEAVRRFAAGVDVLTFEFENVPADTVRWAAEHCQVRPDAKALATAQNRIREKAFLSDGAVGGGDGRRGPRDRRGAPGMAGRAQDGGVGL